MSLDIQRAPNMSGSFGPVNATGSPPTPRRSSVCRNLFGAPDREENARFLRDELNKMYEKDRMRWNFDFHTETPLSGRFEWTRVMSSVDEVNPAYGLLRMPYCRSHSDDRQDEVAESGSDGTASQTAAVSRRAEKRTSTQPSDAKESTRPLKQLCISDFMSVRKRRHSSKMISTPPAPKSQRTQSS